MNRARGGRSPRRATSLAPRITHTCPAPPSRVRTRTRCPECSHRRVYSAYKGANPHAANIARILSVSFKMDASTASLVTPPAPPGVAARARSARHVVGALLVTFIPTPAPRTRPSFSWVPARQSPRAPRTDSDVELGPEAGGLNEYASHFGHFVRVQIVRPLDPDVNFLCARRR